MDNEKKINLIEIAIKNLEPKAKFWNQNSLFLVFGGSFAVMFTSGIELFKIWAKDYSFKLASLSKLLEDWYFCGIGAFFLFGLIICIFSAKKIDNIIKETNIILRMLNEELKELKRIKLIFL